MTITLEKQLGVTIKEAIRRVFRIRGSLPLDGCKAIVPGTSTKRSIFSERGADKPSAISLSLVYLKNTGGNFTLEIVESIIKV